MRRCEFKKDGGSAMKSLRNMIMVAVTSALIIAMGAATGFAAEQPHRLAIQISDNNKQKMNTVLNVAANVVRHYSGLGEQVEVRIVAFNAGLHLMRTDTSPVLKRIKGFASSMPNVKFHACGNTIQGMTKKEGKKPPIIKNATVEPAGGVVKLMELHRAGWTIIRP
jgi:intracellular sulfur oxidation DsrE/DsrF family protein